MSYGGSRYSGASYAGPGGPPAPPGAIAETALTDDALSGLVALAAALAEDALTDDALSFAYDEGISEGAATADGISGAGASARSLVETALTHDSLGSLEEALAEDAATVDAVLTHLVFHRSLAEGAATADAIATTETIRRSVTATIVVCPTAFGFETFTPPAPVPGLTGLHDYEVVVCDKWGIARGQIASAVPTEIQWVLNQIGEALIDCYILDQSLIDLLPISSFPGALEIQIWRDQALIWWGWPTSASFDAKQVHLQCAGLLYPFSVRNFGPVLVNYLLNPQFELPSSGPGVVPEWTVSGVSAFVINQASNPTWPILVGKQALLLIQAVGGTDTYVEQNVAVSGGTQGLFFDLSAWLYLVPGVTYGDALDQRGLFVQLVVGLTAVDVQFQQITADIGQGNWVRMETGITVPPGVTGTLNIRLYAPMGYTIWDACNLTVEESRGSSPTGSDVQEIVDIVVTYAQQPQAGKSDLAIPFSGPRTGTSLIRIYQFADNAGILDALNEFPTIGVCDFEVIWDDTGHFRQLAIYPPAKGSIDYNAVLEIDLGQVTDLQGTVDGTQVMTAPRVLGQGSNGSSEDIGYAAFPSNLGGRVSDLGFVGLGSNTIVCAGLDFTADDVGQGIYCITPGVLPIASTIATVVDSETVTFTNPALLGAMMAVPFPGPGDTFGVGGVIIDSVQSALTNLPISTLQGTALGFLLRNMSAQFLPTARLRADGPDGLFGVVATGDVVPVVFNYGWLSFGPVLMRIATLTLYPQTEELEVQLNPQPLTESSYGG